MPPVSPTAVLLHVAAMLTILNATTSAEDLYDGYIKTGETYSTETTFTLERFLNYYEASSTVTFSTCTATQPLTMKSIGGSAHFSYVTRLHMLWKDTTLNGAGSWNFEASLPNAFIHFLNTKGTGNTVPFLDLSRYITENSTILVDKATMQYYSGAICTAILWDRTESKVLIRYHSIFHIRGVSAQGITSLISSSGSMDIAGESQFYMEDCTAVANSGPVLALSAINVADNSAVVLYKMKGVGNFATVGRLDVDATSVFSFIDIDLTGGRNLFYYPGAFKGAGTFMFSRILIDGWSGLIPMQPENNNKLWVTMKVKGVLQSNAQLSAQEDGEHRFNINTNNKMDWDGTMTGSSNCVSAGLAVEGRADYKKSGSTCVATCKDGFRTPACTKAAPPKPCLVEDCEVCFRTNQERCLLCDPNRKPTAPNSYDCECRFPFCGTCPEVTVCSNCMDGYKLSDDEKNCFKCGLPHCEQCSGHDECKRCATEYKLSETDGKCYKCTMENCNYCSSDGACGECAADHKPANDGKDCYLCTMPDCVECSTHNVCGTCKDGHKPSEIDGKCYECSIANCKYCSSDNVCGKCADGHKPNNGNTECFLCPMHECTECSADNLCKECAPGFKPAADEGSCYVCSGDNCARCGPENDCQACDDGYILTKDKCCVTCNLDNCQRCDVSDVCALCDDQHTVTNSGACVACGVGNCTSCSSAGTCAICACGMVPANKGKRCVECTVSNCRYCDVSGDGKKCAECVDGYDVSNGSCRRSGVPSWILFLIVLAASCVVVASVCVGVFFYLRHVANANQMERDAEERRHNRQAKGRHSVRHFTEIVILDLADLEGAATGVRDDHKTQNVMQ